MASKLFMGPDPKNYQMNRRLFLAGGGAFALASGLPSPLSSDARAQDTRPSKYLILILLQGGLDGLSMLIPWGDPAYRNARRDLAMVDSSGHPAGVPLDNLFALHPAVEKVFWPLWEQGELAFIPSIASPYRGSDHEEARRMMNSGLASAQQVAINPSGWLGRCLSTAGGFTPLQPDLRQLEQVWQADSGQAAQRFISLDHIAGTSFATDPTLTAALEELRIIENDEFYRLTPQHDTDSRFDLDAQALPVMMEEVTRQFALQRSLRVAVLATRGFDTHFRQGAESGILARRMAAVAHAFAIVRKNLASVWDDTLVVATSEFGRSIPINQTGGTDHGLGGLALLAGGQVQGRQTIGQWPGLEGRTMLPPSVDSRSLYKTISGYIWSFSPSELAELFPESENAPLIPNLVSPI